MLLFQKKSCKRRFYSIIFRITTLLHISQLHRISECLIVELNRLSSRTSLLDTKLKRKVEDKKGGLANSHITWIVISHSTVKYLIKLVKLFYFHDWFEKDRIFSTDHLRISLIFLDSAFMNRRFFIWQRQAHCGFRLRVACPGIGNCEPEILRYLIDSMIRENKLLGQFWNDEMLWRRDL